MQAQISHSQIGELNRWGYANDMSLNIRIRTLRKERGLTIAQLAEKVMVSTPHMSQVERGIKKLNNHLLVRIAEALDTAPSDLIADEDDEGLGFLTGIARELDPDRRKTLEGFAAALLQAQQGLALPPPVRQISPPKKD